MEKERRVRAERARARKRREARERAVRLTMALVLCMAAAFAGAVQTLGRDAALRKTMGAAAAASVEPYALDRVLPVVLPYFTKH